MATRVDEYLDGMASHSCTKCGKPYDQAAEDTWVECDFCDSWFYVYCTGLAVLDDPGDKVDYTCELCVAKRISTTQPVLTLQHHIADFFGLFLTKESFAPFLCRTL